MSKPNVKRVVAGLIGVALLVAIFFAVRPLLGGGTDAAGKSGKPKKGPVKVTVATPLVKKIVEWDSYIGRMEAVESVDIRARVSGYLDAHFFKEGDVVKAGDPLFKIDPRPYQAVLSETTAAVAAARAAVSEAKALETQGMAKRLQVKSQLDLTSSRLDRYRKLIDQRAVSQDEFDTLASEQRQAAADLAAADAEIASARAHTTAASAAVNSAIAAKQTAELNLAFTEVTAPISGRISQLYATKGNLIAGGTTGGTEGATMLTTIVSIDPIHCYFNANEREALKYTRLDRSGARESSRNVKNPVYLSLVDEEGFPHLGHMDFVDNRIDDQTGTIRGRAIFPNDDRVLAPGMFAEIRLPGSGVYEAILIPDAAVGLDQSEQYLLVVDADNKVQRRSIELGPIVHGLRVVRKGLKPNERIVTRGVQKARDGAEVIPTEEKIVALEDDGLPDNYRPIPKEEWLSPKPTPKPSMAADAKDATLASGETVTPNGGSDE